jgi:quinol monooxygenase YgiN
MHGEFEKTHCIVVIPSDYGNLAKHRALARRVILYRNLIGIDAKSVLRMRREELAQRGELYISRLGTINSLLHFAWYLGCAEVNLIGCEGTAIGYDPRIGVAANKTHPFGQLIRREQEEVLNLLGFRWRYLGSPPVPTALDQPLVLLMKVQAKPARLKCVLAEVRRLIADSFSKPGCRGVWLYQDYHSYHSLVVVSHWDNDAALVDYLRTDPIRSFRRVCREWLETAMKLNMLSALNIPEHYEAG